MSYQGNCIIYLRKSTRGDDRQTISIESQKQVCDNLVAQRNLRVIDVIEEKRSAKDSGTRPEFQRMLKQCKK